MSFSNTVETDILNYIKATAPSWAGDVTWYWCAHTADPGEAGTATTSEAAYTSYARVACTRSSGLSVSGNTLSNAVLVQFPASTGAGSNITHVSLVTTASGAGTIIGRMALSSSLPTTVGVQPQFAINAITLTLD